MIRIKKGDGDFLPSIQVYVEWFVQLMNTLGKLLDGDACYFYCEYSQANLWFRDEPFVHQCELDPV
jgi:hypothetical protein